MIAADQLKTDYLAQIARGDAYAPRFVHYDPQADILMILAASRDTETIVHYLDDSPIALLYHPDTLEIVGLQVESFERAFLPQHPQVAKAWKLTGAEGQRLEDLGDMILAVETMRPRLARAVLEASWERLGQPGADLAAVFA